MSLFNIPECGGAAKALVMFLAIVSTAHSIMVPCCDIGSLRSAASNSVIYLAAGTFTGACSPTISLASQNVNISGMGATATVLDCTGTSTSTFLGNSLSGGFVSVSNLTIKGASAPANGGAMSLCGTSVYLSNVIFDSNTAHSGYKGGAMIISMSMNNQVTVMRNCTFIRNYSCKWSAGAHVMSSNGASVSMLIDGCTFRQNTAGLQGGGLYLAGGVPTTISGSSFFSNTASQLGGAGGGIITFGPLTVINSVFYGNKGDSNQGTGGAMQAINIVVVINSNFTNNYAGAGGGAYAHGGSGTVSFTNCLFAGNTAGPPAVAGSRGGGGILYQSLTSGFTISGSTFSGNSAAIEGGAVSSSAWSMTLSGNTFTGNTGASVNNVYQATSLNAGIIANNTVTTGPMFALPCTAVYFTSTTFANNTLADTMVNASMASLSITGCLFSSNTAASILRLTAAPASILSTTFSNNTNPYGSGGVINSRGGAAAITIDSCSFTGNSAILDGGVIYTLQGTLNLTRSTFSYNTGRNGGAVLVNQSSLYVSGYTTFSGNSASVRGGAICQDTGTPTIAADTLFVNNNLTGGATPMEASFGGTLGCSLVSPSNFVFPVASRGCPGLKGYECPILCPNGQIGASANQSIQCLTTPLMTNASCQTDAGLVQFAWVANNGSGLPKYGTKGVYSPNNFMGSRDYTTVMHSPNYPYYALIVGGFGYDETGTANWMDDTWLVNTTDYNNPTVTWIDGSRVMQPYHGYATAIGISPRYQPLWWIDGTTAYLYGGWEFSCQGLSDMWTLNMNNITGGWKLSPTGGVSGYSKPAVYGSLHVGVANVTTPGFRFRAGTFTMPQVLPGALLFYGGASWADMWMYMPAANVWTWMGGSQVTPNVNPVYGVRGTPNPANWPGSRSRPMVWVQGTTLFLYGGDQKINGVFLGYNDLWSATYNAVSMNFTWTWLGGGQGVGAPSARPPTPGTFCSLATCYPPSYYYQEILASPQLVSVGLNNVFFYGGMEFYTQTSHDETWAFNVAFGTAAWVTGNHVDQPPFTIPSYRGPMMNGVPGPRTAMLAWPDQARPGEFYVVGSGVHLSGLTNDYRIYRVQTVQTVTVNAVGGMAVTIGQPFTFQVMFTQLGQTGQPNATRVAVAAVSGANIGTVSVLSNGAVNGIATVALVSGTITGASIYTLTATISDHFVTSPFNVTFTCTPGCITCTAPGLTAAACQQCNLTMGYFSDPVSSACVTGCNTGLGYVADPVTGLCVTSCQFGWYKGATSCVACDTRCANCTAAGITQPVCTCNTTSLYARDTGTNTCVACGPASGSYIVGVVTAAVCTACSPVTHCTGAVTCLTATTSRCAGCGSGYFFSAGGVGSADTCPPCTGISDCSGAITCASASTSRCAACTSGFYLVAGGAGSADTCVACTAVANCGGAITCTSPSNSRCASCAGGWYLVPGGAAADTCAACASITNCAGAVTCGSPSTARCASCADGFYLAPGGAGSADTCVTCPPIGNCTGAVTCASAVTSRCALCATSFHLVAGGAAADTCPPCTGCGANQYILNECSPTLDNRNCQPCSTCASGTYETAPCLAGGPFANTQCTPCTPVPGCAQPISCSVANRSSCAACVTGRWAELLWPASQDVCHVCSTCQTGTFLHVRCQTYTETECMACDYGCADCSGPGLSSLTCRACNETVGYGLTLAGTACVAACPMGQYMRAGNSSAPAQCTPCTSGCVACTGPGLETLVSDGVTPGNCSVCDEASGYLLSPTGVCVQTCPTGYFANRTASPFFCPPCGSTCAAGYFQECSDPSDAKCTGCSPGCKTCTGLGVELNEYCTACDEDNGYAASEDGTMCGKCAANCTLCSGSPTHCTTCAANYTGAPGCAPVCESPGCMGCLAPDACAICGAVYSGHDCKTCSSLSQAGSAYPSCVAARQTDVVGTGSSLGVLIILGVLVTILALCKPLPVFYTGVDTIHTPSQDIPVTVDFILSTRRLRVSAHPPAPVTSVTLEGAGILPEGIELVADDEKSSYMVNLSITRKQTSYLLSRDMRLNVVADAGSGPVSTKRKLVIPLRMSFSNVLAIFTILLDFIQLSAFGFGGGIQWWNKDPVPGSLHFTLIQLPTVPGLWYVIFWAMVGLVGLWVIIVGVLKTGLDAKMAKYGAYRSASSALYAVFMPIVGQTLYLPIISTMLSAMACSRPVTDLSDSFTASFDSHVVCWEGEHWLYVVVSMVVIILYYPLAVYTSPLWQTISPTLDVRYFPTYLIVSTQVKFVLAVTVQLFSKVAYLPSILLIALPLPVVLIVMRSPPVIINSLRWPIAASYASVTWSGIASLFAIQYPDFWMSSLILYVGWGVLFGAGIVVALRPTKHEDEHTVVASGTDALRRVLAGAEESGGEGPLKKEGGDVPAAFEATHETAPPEYEEKPLMADAAPVPEPAIEGAIVDSEPAVVAPMSRQASAVSIARQGSTELASKPAAKKQPASKKAPAPRAKPALQA